MRSRKCSLPEIGDYVDLLAVKGLIEYMEQTEICSRRFSEPETKFTYEIFIHSLSKNRRYILRYILSFEF